MARRKTTRRTTGTTTAAKRRTTRRPARSKNNSNKIVNFFVPMFFIFCILFCLGFLIFMGYRTATASAFFDVENVEMHGVKNIEKEQIKQIVKSYTVQNGVWNADIDAIKREVKNFKYAEEVSVSRVLPNTIRVIVKERIPVAIIRIDGKDFWADKDGLLLNSVSGTEEHTPFIMFGWDQSDTGRSAENNKKRVKLYIQLLEEWKEFELAKRVKAVDLFDLRDPQAIVEDSGQTVRIILSKEEFRKDLQKGIENIAGRGNEVKSIDMGGANPVISYRDS